jgi:catechol 2,3-dioxygenase
VGKVRLAVSNLERSIAFYRDVIGLAMLSVDAGKSISRLGAHGETRVLLELEASGVEPVGRHTRLGLYHTAFLLPSRESFSAFVQHLNQLRVRFGAGDHLVSEALYLSDPDGLQVEVYVDRPRSTWQTNAGEIVMATDPVRFDQLPKVAPDSWKGAPAGTTVGHVHFYVGDLERAAAFYRDGLGLDATCWRYPGALFLGAGGYHHHVGTNLWAAGSPPASARDARLLFWELRVPNQEEIERVAARMSTGGFREEATAEGLRSFTDPWGITVMLVPHQPVDQP